MNSLRKIFLLVSITAFFTLGVSGCKKKTEQPSVDQPTTVVPAEEHPAGEHPTSEHPTEHPK